MRTRWLRNATTITVAAIIVMINFTNGVPVEPTRDVELTLDPMEAIVYAGDNVTFTCSCPNNVSFDWDLNDWVRPYQVIHGVTKALNGTRYWNKLHLFSVKRSMSGEISCSVVGSPNVEEEAFLIVNGVQIGGACRNDNDCITDKATCQKGICSCPQDEVLLKLTENGYEVCRKMIYRLYEPCEFTEQCFHLVDSKAVCSKSGICICAPWAMDVNGKCDSKSEMANSKNQELYRVGLVAITCLIIVIVAVSMWITLRRSCQMENIEAQLRSITQNEETISEEVIMENMDDKPPSYDDLLDSADNVSSPPEFKEALTSSKTAKKFLRQSSAPAGQLICTGIINNRPLGKLSSQKKRS